jgi:hypothetical protein
VAACDWGQQGASAKHEDGKPETGREKRFDLQLGVSYGASKAPAFKDKSTDRRGDRTNSELPPCGVDELSQLLTHERPLFRMFAAAH